MSIERDLNRRIAFIDTFITPPKRLLIRGGRELLKMWVEAVKSGKIQATPEQVGKTEERIREYDKALASSLPPENPRAN